MNSIVIFGQAHSGKSTLLGYLIATDLGLDLDKLEKSYKKEMGNVYNANDFYRYIVDDTKYERLGMSRRKKSLGSTIDYHIRKIELPDVGEITIIDTPGVEHRRNARQKGMYYGNIGVFCIEMNDVIGDDFYKKGSHYTTVISSLMLWTSFKKQKVIIALTKADLCNFSELSYEIAKERILSICNEISMDVNVLPIAIEVEKRIEHNILSLSDALTWYKGETLCKMMANDVSSLKDETQTNRLLFCVDRQIKKPTSYVGKVWRIKVISGKLRVDDEIILSPVVNSNNQFITISAKIKSIRFDNHQTEEKILIDEISSGCIVGIDLKDIKCCGKSFSKNDFNTIYTTCGFSASAQFKTSKYFQFEIARKYEEVFPIRRQLSLLWFGRSITFEVKRIIKKSNTIFVNAAIITRYLSLPIDENDNYYFESLIILDNNKGIETPYYDAKLIKLLDEAEV